MIYALMAAAVAALAAAWLIRLRFWPYGPCPTCRGRKGRGIGSGRQAWSRCRRCDGAGERLRTGARIWARNRELNRRP